MPNLDAEVLNEPKKQIVKDFNKEEIVQIIQNAIDKGIINLGDIGGSEVVANPTLEGTESNLEGLEVDGEKYKIPEGTVVEANPTLAGTESPLTGLQVGDEKYKVGGGTSHLFVIGTGSIDLRSDLTSRGFTCPSQVNGRATIFYDSDISNYSVSNLKNAIRNKIKKYNYVAPIPDIYCDGQITKDNINYFITQADIVFSKTSDPILYYTIVNGTTGEQARYNFTLTSFTSDTGISMQVF